MSFPDPIFSRITPARLGSESERALYNTEYDDVYHSAHGGLGQARHVFLGGNRLLQRWQAQRSDPERSFVIIETGFGIGLNFLATWQAWEEACKAEPARHACVKPPSLHYIAFEKHPLSSAQLAAAQQAFPELAPWAAQLRAAWPPLVPGWHRSHHADGRLTLDLIFDDASTAVQQLQAEADAYYLDGFAPRRNPQLWSAEFLAALSRHARAGATLATWSVAGTVRTALAQAGWQLRRERGFAGKRVMLCGEHAGVSPTPGAASKTPPRSGFGEKTADVIVIGAGLAGSAAAERLAARGWAVDLIDAASGPGQGASGNHAGVLRPLPARDDNRLARLTRAAYLYTRKHLITLAEAGLPLRWAATGVLHLARDDHHQQVQAAVVASQNPPPELVQFVDADQARALAAWPALTHGGWWFPQGGWVAPASLCCANLARFPAAIRPHWQTTITRIARVDGQWQVFDAASQCVASAPVLVLAQAVAARALVGDWLPLRAARGQVSTCAAHGGSAPPLVVCRLGYLTPVIDGQQSFGATFVTNDPAGPDDTGVRAADHAENLAKLDFILPGRAAALDPAALGGRVGHRPIAPDRLPMVGPVPVIGSEKTPVDGLWLINGFGARGLVWSALAGELLAAQIAHEPLPLEAELAAALAPARFLQGRRSAGRPTR